MPDPTDDGMFMIPLIIVCVFILPPLIILGIALGVARLFGDSFFGPTILIEFLIIIFSPRKYWDAVFNRKGRERRKQRNDHLEM